MAGMPRAWPLGPLLFVLVLVCAGPAAHAYSQRGELQQLPGNNGLDGCAARQWQDNCALSVSTIHPRSVAAAGGKGGGGGGGRGGGEARGGGPPVKPAPPPRRAGGA